MAYRVAATGQYSCPRCVRPLTTYRAGAFVVDGCLACGGLFIDANELPKVARAYRRALDGAPTDMASDEVAALLEHRWTGGG